MTKLLLTFSLLILANSADAETLVQLRNRVDTWLTNKWPTVVARQNTYFTNNGRYWQGLITHSNIPPHVTATAADSVGNKLSSRPTDQTHTWLDVFPEWNTESLAAAVVIDSYRSPSGHGWVATVFVKYNGLTYTRTKATGPETWRDAAWAVFTPPP